LSLSVSCAVSGEVRHSRFWNGAFAFAGALGGFLRGLGEEAGDAADGAEEERCFDRMLANESAGGGPGEA
jgi:hypothetical protein